ncbi:MAG: hypothetical protein DYG93_04645 [Leptolyngbya sp. PLA2]|nr:hypothetical protein [Leptolyngbya sp.]MCE7970937.1 hypothetical protein [Leptolyngbya sp. PL-A2]MCQ3940248.1 hypothetical protein [cyanobacterium CYA1]MDL1904682.1 hypothetical protein [Synechococcales cyanobacterium CNB]
MRRMPRWRPHAARCGQPRDGRRGSRRAHAMFRRFTIVPSLVSFVVAALCAAVPSHAQVRPVEPYHAVVTVDGAAMRSGDMADYYKVAELKRGQVVRVDAEGNGWARVAYPAGVTAFVDAREVQVEGETARLTRRSALKARSMVAGWGASWQRLMPEGSELEPGATLKIVQPVRNRENAIVGYEVEPPAGARGYIASNNLRTATAEEVRAHRASPGEPAGQTPQPRTPPVQEQPTPPALETPDVVPTPAPADEAAPSAPPVVAPAPVEPPAPLPETERAVGTFDALEAAFESLRQQDPDRAELSELAAEIRRAADALDDSPYSQGIRRSLDQRLAVVELWIRLRETRAMLAEKRAETETHSSRVAERIAALERTRGYEFVGRVVPSSLYDGRRLPLMYRIVSVGGVSPRTIGYVLPDDRFDLGAKVGRVVGVVGEARMDEALGLRIVVPHRIDVLRPEDGVGADAADSTVRMD